MRVFLAAAGLASLAVTATAAAAILEFPKLKSGQWELTMSTAKAGTNRRPRSRRCAPTTRSRRK